MGEKLCHPFLRGLIPALSAAAMLQCGGGGGSGAPNAGAGVGSSFTVIKVQWGRFVDLVDSSGALIGPQIIAASFVADGLHAKLQGNPVTGHTELQILDSTPGSPAFEATLAGAKEDLVSVTGKGPAALGGYAMIPRNAGVRIVFNKQVNPATLSKSTLQWLAGAGAFIPYEPGTRVVDPLDSFSVLVNPVVLGPENAQLGINVNPTGFPPSDGSPSANLLLRLPSLIDPLVGQNSVLADVEGKPVIAGNNPSNPVTQATELYFRSGGALDPFNGFLQDGEAPRIVGRRNILLGAVEDLGQGIFRVPFSVEGGACASLAVSVGDAILQGAAYGRVSEIESNAPGPILVKAQLLSGSLAPQAAALWKMPFDETAHAALKPCFVSISGSLDGNSPTSSLSVDSSFIVEFSEPVDPASVLPFRTFAVTNQDGGPVTNLKTPASAGGAHWDQFVVGRIEAANDLSSFAFVPSLPLNSLPFKRYDLHVVGGSGGVRDLAGNELALNADFLVDSMSLASGQASMSGGVAFRFVSPALDEDGDGIPESNAGSQGLGQGLYNSMIGGGVQGRSAVPYARNVTPSQPFVGKMISLASTGVQTPLVNYGARMMTVYRPQDIFGGDQGGGGPSVTDKETWQVDVIGLSWCPAGGNLLPDTFGRFDGFMAHALYSPINRVTTSGTNLTDLWQYTGLNPLNSPTGANLFANQALETANVNAGSVGIVGMGLAQSQQVFGGQYNIVPSNQYALGGTVYYPYKAFDQSFTWRNLTYVESSGPNVGKPYLAGGRYVGPGNPAGGPTEEYADPSELNVVNPGTQNQVYKLSKTSCPSKSLPSIALPLLMDFKCYNNQQTGSIQAQAKNSLAVSIMFGTNQTGTANPPWVTPATRCFTQGYFNPTNGSTNWVDPSAATIPQGGWNVAGNTQSLAFEPVIYLGRVDLQNRSSLFFSRWIDTGFTNPEFGQVVMEPDASLLPAGTQVLLEFRGASMIPNGSGAFDARQLDPYGNCNDAIGYAPWQCNLPPVGITAWTSNLASVAGSRYVQMRVTLIANLASMVSPTLRAVGISFQPGS